ncbi:unnamed protein product [Leptidea sinapis]|uniref:Chitin-binding type-2 domain-containing protein n=1 Tax=Leptidea sinapis TaxID=189913 RepID=A0A5E4QES5_9NEOP|nr:unnamed protein product [Leptidea sinapis]
MVSLVIVWLWLLLFVFQNEFRISRSIQPGYLDFDNLPETNFTCTGKVIGGYYADLETSCQMFHVCTVGQQDEPMDIKFLCLNGTVFDQETRVCERVDEVDCTKSEKFYSLNLELYGNTVPPIIDPESSSQSTPTDSQIKAEESTESFVNESSTNASKTQNQTIDLIDTTEDPVHETNKNEFKDQINNKPTLISISKQEEEEYEEDEEDSIDSENAEYEDEYPNTVTTSMVHTITTTSSTTKIPTSSSALPMRTHRPPVTHYISSHPPTISSVAPSTYSSVTSTSKPSSTLDPSLLSPQEFIYRHRGPGSEAISFQRQNFRPADGVYITHAPSQQFDHFQYESSRTAPRPAAPRPVAFAQRPQPAPFRATTIDPRDQLLRPGPSPHLPDITLNHRNQHHSSLPSQQTLPFNPFYYDRKRSDDSGSEYQSSLTARSVAPIIETERPVKPKSPPRVIVTASASVSDSNGKRLNYTVGNVVSAVKPIVAINYDDFKESDLLFDPFFLDVPKLHARRKSRSNQYRHIFNVPETATISSSADSVKNTKPTLSPVTSRATTVKAFNQVKITTPTPITSAWNPDDYVDDNYEPHVYVPPVLPLAVVMARDLNKIVKYEAKTDEGLIKEHNKIMDIRVEQPKVRPSATQKVSSQSAGTEATHTMSPLPILAPACAASRTSDCRNRA